MIDQAQISIHVASCEKCKKKLDEIQKCENDCLIKLMEISSCATKDA